MIKLGIIGTGAITHHFISAAHNSGYYQLSAIYSRQLQTAELFAKQYEHTTCYTNLTEFLSGDIDAVYIASPNSFHFQQAKQAIMAEKHVIIEKPAVSRVEEWEYLTELAQEKNVYVLEAARNYHEKAFSVVSNFLAHKNILGAHFSYAKYSSKMKTLLSGEIPNVFSSEFSGGALMDLGIYTIYAAVRLFGSPKTSHYTAQQLDNSIDMNGVGILHYPNFNVTIYTGKNIESSLPAEIYTTEGTLRMNSIEHIKEAVFVYLNGEEERLPIQQTDHTMAEEVDTFASILNGRNETLYQQCIQAAVSVHQTLLAMRQDAQIVFSVDNDK